MASRAQSESQICEGTILYTSTEFFGGNEFTSLDVLWEHVGPWYTVAAESSDGVEYRRLFYSAEGQALMASVFVIIDHIREPRFRILSPIPVAIWFLSISLMNGRYIGRAEAHGE